MSSGDEPISQICTICIACSSEIWNGRCWPTILMTPLLLVIHIVFMCIFVSLIQSLPTKAVICKLANSQSAVAGEEIRQVHSAVGLAKSYEASCCRSKFHRCQDRQTNLSTSPETPAALVMSESQQVAADVNGLEAGQVVRFSWHQ